MTKSFFFVLCLVLLWSLPASAFTVVLKDGRRIEVQKNYRLVNDVAIFTFSDGKRMSVSVRNIDVSATELANGQDAGDFVRQAASPLPIVDSDASNPGHAGATNGGGVAKSKPRITRKLVNSDFEGFKQRREEKEVSAPGLPGGAVALNEPPPPPPTKTSSVTDERKTEQYWKSRSRQLLTEINIQEELIGILEKQLADLEASNRRNGPGYGVIQTPGSVVVTRNGGYYNPGTTVVVPNTNRTREQDQESRVRERLMDAQLQLSSLQIRYAALEEEARHEGVPPGWLR